MCKATQATALLLNLLRTTDSDEAARAAAEQLAKLVAPDVAEGPLAQLLGITFHRHREFSQSILFLNRSFELQKGPATKARFKERYAQARNLFWRAQYHLAETRFSQLADLAGNSEDKARSLYQKARSIEMKGDWLSAAATCPAHLGWCRRVVLLAVFRTCFSIVDIRRRRVATLARAWLLRAIAHGLASVATESTGAATICRGSDVSC